MRQGFVFVIIVSAVFCAPVLAYDWSTNPGEGSPENPYQISTPEQLIAIGSDPNVYNLFKHFALTSDIIFDPNNNPEHVFNGAVIPRLRGSIDGCGFAIENLRISADTSNGDRVGLIGTFGDHGNRRLENLNIPNAQITIEGNAQEVGILCGLNGGYIHNCDVSGTITCGSGYQIGGICGVNGREAMGLYGAITHCQTDVSISSSSTRGRFEECGGISGYGNGNIIHCSSVGNISAWSLNVVGGISGFQWYGSIISSSTSVNISAQRSLYYSGGLCGRNRFGIISHSYATGNMTLEGTSFISSSELYWVGAFCGHNIEGTIENCYSTGDIYCSSVEFGGGEESGGFCGRNSFGSEIRNCFSTGDIVCGPITGDIPAMHKSRWVGGFCGTNDA